NYTAFACSPDLRTKPPVVAPAWLFSCGFPPILTRFRAQRWQVSLLNYERNPTRQEAAFHRLAFGNRDRHRGGPVFWFEKVRQSGDRSRRSRRAFGGTGSGTGFGKLSGCAVEVAGGFQRT